MLKADLSMRVTSCSVLLSVDTAFLPDCHDGCPAIKKCSFRESLSSIANRNCTDLPKPMHSIILEEALLELVPEKFRKHDSCKLVENRFGIPPELQILDDNYHQQLIAKLSNREKRGRPDIVHFALLDITSTPAYMEGLVEVYVHTINNTTIKILSGVRLPRTFQRFCGVMAKVLSGKMEEKEKVSLRSRTNKQ